VLAECSRESFIPPSRDLPHWRWNAAGFSSRPPRCPQRWLNRFFSTVKPCHEAGHHPRIQGRRIPVGLQQQLRSVAGDAAAGHRVHSVDVAPAMSGLPADGYLAHHRSASIADFHVSCRRQRKSREPEAGCRSCWRWWRVQRSGRTSTRPRRRPWGRVLVRARPTPRGCHAHGP
jgi:hypothetical protein